MTEQRTGWPPGLLQDDDRRLSRALSNTPHARRLAEEAAAVLVHDHRTGEKRLRAVTVIQLDSEGQP